MRDFFRGWRRKFGVVTLVLACVFAAGWVRSYAGGDSYLFEEYSPLGIFSCDGEITWLGLSANDPNSPPTPLRLDPEFEVEGAPTVFIKPSPMRFVVRTVPYWSIALPLTLLSSYLLLRRPRPAKPNTVSETAAAGGPAK